MNDVIEICTGTTNPSTDRICTADTPYDSAFIDLCEGYYACFNHVHNTEYNRCMRFFDAFF